MVLTDVATTMSAACLASMVELVEALTVVLAMAATRGWSGALAGAGVAAGVLIALVAAFGPALAAIPLSLVQLVVGALLLLFGMRWLRKAILRAAGILPKHDEEAAFAKETAAMQKLGGGRAPWDKVAFAASFKITMLEGVEVVFIVIALGAGGADLMLPAAFAAFAALIAVVLLGVAIHRPLSKVPENTLKFVVGVLLCAFGSFWVGEGIGAHWPGADLSILGLIVGFGATALALVQACAAGPARAGSAS